MNGQAKRFSGCEIDHELELGQPFDWQVAGLGTPGNDIMQQRKPLASQITAKP